MTAIRVNSADSHVLEPHDLWKRALPPRLGDRAPWTVRADGRETVYVDGSVMRRDPIAFSDAMRPPGAEDIAVRLTDLDDQGIWAEAVFPSRGLWIANMTDRELAAACATAYNDWCANDVNGVSSRLIGAAILSSLDTGDAVAELHRALDLGFKGFFLPATPPADRPYNAEVWEPLWSAMEEAAAVPCFHIGTGGEVKLSRGPGGAVINYVETNFPGQRVVAHLVASGALDRHPDLRIVIAEGGVGWVPALGDRMDEAYRQHGMFVRPALSMLPSELIHRQVYTSFQHDRSAVPTVTALGYDKVMWGSDYPHLEGTFPNTQKVLHGLFDDVDPAVTHRITVGAFCELFDLDEPPVLTAA